MKDKTGASAPDAPETIAALTFCAALARTLRDKGILSPTDIDATFATCNLEATNARWPGIDSAFGQIRNIMQRPPL